MRVKILSRCFLLVFTFALSACGKSSDTGVEQNGNANVGVPELGQAQPIGQEVAFDLGFSAVLSQQIQATNPGIFDDFQVNLLNGSMLVDNLDDSTSETFSWTVNLDESDLSNVQSLKTLQLKPGNYAFYLLLGDTENQYTGETIHTVTDGAAELIPMTIRPVIGQQITGVDLLDTLIDFKFSYSQSELASAGLADPSIGISIDGGTELIFDVDPATGLSEHMNLNLLAGVYDIVLRLYEGGAQVGKSADGAGVGISIAPGFDVSLDIIPLFGEVGVALAVEGGDATFEIIVPNEVIDEAGGVAGLEATLSVVGANNPLQEFTLNLSPDENGPGFKDIVTLTDMYFGDVNIELAFNDTTTSDNLGSCVDTVPLSSALTFFECKLTLTRRSLVGGNILSTLGVTVIDEGGAPVSGATISVDGADAAITNGATSTPGYSKLTLVPGSHQIEAVFGDQFGNTDYNALALGVGNIDLVLDKNVLLNDSFDGTQTGVAAPLTYWYGGISPSSCSGYVQSGFLFLGSIYNDPTTDWCEKSVAVTSHSFEDQAVLDSGGFSVSVDVYSATAANSEIMIGVGGELGNDPSNYDPMSSANALVSVTDNTLAIEAFDGTGFQTITHSIPYLVSEVSNLTISVTTPDFQDGTSGSVEIMINKDTALSIPAAGFIWDGGANHIQVVGAAGEPIAGSGTNYIYFDSLLVKPL